MKINNKTKALIITIAVTTSPLLLISNAQAADTIITDLSPQIFFLDTFTNDGATDWTIRADEDDAGGYFQIRDQIGPTNAVVLQINHSANNSNSLMVDSSGDVNLANGSVFIDKSTNNVGIGTSTPATSIHLLNSNTPTIRLDQNGGFGAQSWDIAGNEANFFIRDSTINPRTLPFRIKPGSPTSSIYIHPEGVGIGSTNTPEAKLDVTGDIKASFNGANTTSGLVELFKMSVNNTNTGEFSDAGFAMENARSGFSWAFRTLENTGGFAASKQGTGAKEFEVRNPTTVASNVELHLANGARNVNGQWLNASSRSYKENINELSGADAMQALKGLKSVTYQFKRDKDNTQRVGFIAEDIPALLATKDRKTVDSLQIISVLTKAVQVQNEALKVQEKSLQDVKVKVKAKDAKIAGMEATIAKLILMQEQMAKTMEARFTPFAAESFKVNQQITALNRE